MAAAAPELPVWYQRELAAQGGAWSVVSERDRGHGRREWRILWLLADPALNASAGSAGAVGTAWPHLQQVFRLERHRTRRQGGIPTTSVEVTFGITSLPPVRADAPALLHLQRGHWGIENRLHWRRDVTFDEDRCQVRSGAAPQVMAACRNLAIGLLHRAGAENIAAAMRTNAARPRDAVALICPGVASQR